jgi:hypothetical protein
MKPRIRTYLLIGLALISIVGLEAVFRPDLHFVKSSINEAIPTAMTTTLNGTANVAPNPTSTTAPLMTSSPFITRAHTTTGTAELYDLGNGKHAIRLSNFSTSNGPDVRIYLVKGSDGSNASAITSGDYVDLGSLKASQGNQNYEIPANVDISQYKGVTVWCRRFGVIFGYANLT